SNEDAIVPANYRKGVRNAVGVSSLLRYFLASRFVEQYFFFDCCRNLFKLGEARLDEFDPNQPSEDQLAPDQFVIFATAPGLKARDGGGLLPDISLDGLGGGGKAKLWVKELKQYIIQFNRLFAYINERFESMPVQPVVGGDGTKPFIQAPRLSGEHRRDPVVV